MSYEAMKEIIPVMLETALDQIRLCTSYKFKVN